MKIMTRILIALVCLIVAAPLAAKAETPDPAFALELGQYNQADPTQNKDFERGSRLLSGKILDSQGRTLGKVSDIQLDRSGSLQAVDASLNRLGGHSADLPLDSSTLPLKATQGNYQLSQNANQVRSLLPQLLANVESAAGPGLGDSVSVQKLIGGSVFSEKGPRIGTVEDVMFSYGGGRAHSLLLRVDYKAVSGKRVAVPFSAVTFREGNLHTDVVMDSPRSQTLVEFVK